MTLMTDIYDPHRCLLGEGPLWHPERQELFWFDILAKELRSAERSWQFPDYVSAAGWVDRDTLLIASSKALSRFDISTGWSEALVPLEADDPVTRSNDGRADPWGGFWIGTMGIASEPHAGAIYRYWRGTVTKLIDHISISNSICFAPDRSAAYWADTPERLIMRQPLEPTEGWPEGPAEVFLDLREEGLAADGSVCDAEGNLWNAQWGSSRVAVYSPEGKLLKTLDIPGRHTTCPAFGGADLTTLYVTSSADGLEGEGEGRTFVIEGAGQGVAEHQVIL